MDNFPDAPHFDCDGLLYSNRFDDHYFSRHDGRAECAHVFLAGNELPGRWSHCKCFTIGELGFGTGLNFLETWANWQRKRQPGQRLHFVSVEAYPLHRDVARQALDAWPQLQSLADQLLAAWHQLDRPIALDPQTILDIRVGDVEETLCDFPMIEAWYLDGFSPSKNPKMWSAEVMETIANHTVPGGTFASYTSAGWVRRNLEAAGFRVEKRPGFGKKREMIAGRKS